MEKEKWIEDILQSTASMQRAEASPFLLTRLRGKLQSPLTAARRVPAWVAYFTTALVLLMLAANVTVWSSQEKNKPNAGVKQLIQEYGLYEDSYSSPGQTN